MTLPVLWIGIVAGPVAWLVYLQVNYMLVPAACQAGDKTVLSVVTAVAFIAAAVVTSIAWRSWRASGADNDTEEGSALARNRFMALSGLGISALIFLLVIASAIPIFVLGACD